MAKKTVGKPVDIGIDLTSNELRVTALNKHGNDYVLERFAIADLSPQFFAAGRIADTRGLSARLKEVLETNGISAKRAIVSLSGKAAIVRVIELPRMGAPQTRQAINLQINQYVPFPPGDTVYDYRVLPQRKGGNQAMQEILLVATRASTIQSMVEMLQIAGIETYGIKITSLAAWNLLGSKLEGYTQSVGVVDIRDSISELSFFLDGSFRMARSVELGYNTIIGKIAQLLGVGVGEAEEYLRAEPVDLMLNEEEVDQTEDNRLREAVMAVFASFVTELVRSIRYYESQAARTDRVGKLMVFGNTRNFKNLGAYLERETGLEVAEVSLSSLVQYQQGVYALDVLHAHAEKFVVSAGLCVDYFRKGKVEFNLLPSTYYVRAQALNVLKIGVVLLLIMGGFMYYQNKTLDTKLGEVKNNLQQVQAEQNKWKPNADKFEQVKSEISTKKPQFGQIYSLVKAQLMWPAIMEELGNVIPDTCYLEEVSFDASTGEIKMKGVAVDRVDIMQFAISLDHSDFFTGTTVKETTESMATGGGGGIGAGGGGGGAAGMGLTADMKNPYAPSIPPPDNPNASRSILPQKGSKWDSQQALSNKDFRDSMPADFELPRLGIRAGRTIEDYFQRQDIFESPVKFSFEITTKLADKALNQPKAIESLSALEEVTKDVLNT
jgi:type IV pilus assembly protein PilM